MRIINLSLILFCILSSISGCKKESGTTTQNTLPKDTLTAIIDSEIIDTISAGDIIIKKEFLYDKYTLADTFPYKDTTRHFQWEKIRERLALLENTQKSPALWAVLQNYKNKNKEAPLVRNFYRNEYKLIADTLGVSRYQSVPLYLPNDTTIPEIYSRDGSLVRILANDTTSDFIKIETFNPAKEWLVPRRYVNIIGHSDSINFHKTVFVDVTNQSIATIEKSDSAWLVRSMNPATTGRHRPPYAHETPVGIFVIQEKKTKMVYLHDGSPEVAGFAPYASRFTNGAYLHGVPSALPQTAIIEYSPSLGTTPRSHMCVRNASSHAKFIFDWGKLKETLVFVID